MASTATMYSGHTTKAARVAEGTPRKPPHEYPPEDYVPPPGTLRVHSPEVHSARNTGRILQQWSLCRKPRTEPSGGCRNGYFGYFVRSGGVIRKAIWVGQGGNGVCDWVDEESEEVTDDDSDDDEGIEEDENHSE